MIPLIVGLLAAISAALFGVAAFEWKNREYDACAAYSALGILIGVLVLSMLYVAKGA